MLLPKSARVVAVEAVKRIKNSPEVISGQVSIAFGIATARSMKQVADALKQSDARMYRDKLKHKMS